MEQSKKAEQNRNGTRAKLGSQLKEPVRSVIAEMSRSDFDNLLSQFDMRVLSVCMGKQAEKI